LTKRRRESNITKGKKGEKNMTDGHMAAKREADEQDFWNPEGKKLDQCTIDCNTLYDVETLNNFDDEMLDKYSNELLIDKKSKIASAKYGEMLKRNLAEKNKNQSEHEKGGIAEKMKAFADSTESLNLLILQDLARLTLENEASKLRSIVSDEKLRRIAGKPFAPDYKYREPQTYLVLQTLNVMLNSQHDPSPRRFRNQYCRTNYTTRRYCCVPDRNRLWFGSGCDECGGGRENF